MKFSGFSLALVAASAASVAFSFTPIPALSRSSASESGTSLFISSWGKTPGATTQADKRKDNIITNIQSYLPEPEAVDARDLMGDCLVSGFVNSKDRTDQFIFDLLNHEESAFEFDKIVAFVDDEKSSRKRLLSRSARYTGLLDKLEFKEAAMKGGLPVAAQLEGVCTWLACLEANDDTVAQVKEIAALAKGAEELENISIMILNANGFNMTTEVRNALTDDLYESDCDYNLLMFGEMIDREEGKLPFTMRDFESDDEKEALLDIDAVFSRQEAMRMAAETLQLESGANLAITFDNVYNVNATDARLIKGLREAGYERFQEMDYLLRGGVAKYQADIDEFEKNYPNWEKNVEYTEAWWETPEFQAKIAELENKKGGKKEEEEVPKKDERQIEVEKIALEWAKREFFSQTMAGTVDEDMDQEEFIDSVWERALVQGELKYRQLRGEDLDVDGEMLDFKIQQERKQEIMLKKAKNELQEVLVEEDLGGVDDNVDVDDE